MNVDNPINDSVAAWARKFHLTARIVIDSTLRPHGLGGTQWAVLYHLAKQGPTPQRDLAHIMQIERPTLSAVVSALVRKGYIEQVRNPNDHRRRRLRMTPEGEKLWKELPDPVDRVVGEAFHGIPQDDLDTVIRVLATGTERLHGLLEQERNNS